MKNKNLVAYGIIASLSLAILTGLEVFNEDMYNIAGLGFFVFGIWSSIILLNNN